MAKKETIDVANITHPGIILAMELKARRFTQKTLASQIAIQPSHLSEIIKGKRNITETLAEKLEKTLDIPADYWIKLQAQYDYAVKAANLENTQEAEAAAVLNDYDRIYDMKELFKRIGISMKRAVEKLKFCRETLLFTTPAVQLRQMRQFQGCYHRSEKTGLDPRMIATWTVLARYEASIKPNPTVKYEKGGLDGLAKELRVVFNENNNTVNRVERTLVNHGIKFCVVPKIKHASVDGYSFICNGVPSIVITQRFNRIDNMAFAVMHEVGHLKLHSIEDGEGNINLPLNDAETIPAEEKAANDYAADALIPESIWASLPNMPINPQIIQKVCTKWAKDNSINKWIALGRVSHETGMYMFKSDASREIN